MKINDMSEDLVGFKPNSGLMRLVTTRWIDLHGLYQIYQKYETESYENI